jgi:hypothetical protein
MSSDTIEHVVISTERLKQLEQIESAIPNMIELALKEYKQNALKRLHEKDKLNPEAVNIRAKRYAQKNREMLNAKRREKRRLEKLEREERARLENVITRTPRKTGAPTYTCEPITVSLGQSTIRETSGPCPVSEHGKTIRFDD